MKRSIFHLALALGGALAIGQAHAAAWTYSSPTATGTCAPLDSSGLAADFSITNLVHSQDSVAYTLKMAFVMPTDTSTRPDIIFIQRNGLIRYYTALTGAVTTMGTIPSTDLSLATEDGLIGVAVEKPFKNRVYVVYSHQVTSNASNKIISGYYRLKRFDLIPNTKLLDMANGKVLLDIPSARNRWHTAGGLAFDNDGNLYWAVGDNESNWGGPGNTHDLRGSIVRIHPNDNGVGYTIPAGNFAEYWSNVFTGQGRTALAATYKDTSKVNPAIFVKGVRNAYVMNVEPNTKEVTWSQCGPDYGGNSEEASITKTPVFNGWPWWAGSTNVPASQVSGGQYGKNGAAEPTDSTASPNYYNLWVPASKTAPVNRWTKTMAGLPGPGADTLPPVTQAKYFYGKSCSMGSLVWRYDGKAKATTKFPPQMNRVWITGDYDTRRLKAAKVDSTGTILGAMSSGWLPSSYSSSSTAATVQAITDIKQGPDGSMYISNYSCGSPTSAGTAPGVCGGLARVDYIGATCSDTALATGIRSAQRLVPGAKVDWLHVGVNSFSVFANGSHTVRLSDVNGRVVMSAKGEGQKEYQLPSSLQNGYYLLQVISAERGTTVSSISRF